MLLAWSRLVNKRLNKFLLSHLNTLLMLWSQGSAEGLYGLLTVGRDLSLTAPVSLHLGMQGSAEDANLSPDSPLQTIFNLDNEVDCGYIGERKAVGKAGKIIWEENF